MFIDASRHDVDALRYRAAEGQGQAPLSPRPGRFPAPGDAFRAPQVDADAWWSMSACVWAAASGS
jgi:hypothetical protein